MACTSKIDTKITLYTLMYMLDFYNDMMYMSALQYMFAVSSTHCFDDDIFSYIQVTCPDFEKLSFY